MHYLINKHNNKVITISDIYMDLQNYQEKMKLKDSTKILNTKEYKKLTIDKYK